MKYKVVYDKQGNIVSAGYIDRPEPEIYDSQTPRFGPVAEEGQTVSEIEVPEEMAKLSLTDFVESLRVDIEAQSPRLEYKGGM